MPSGLRVITPSARVTGVPTAIGLPLIAVMVNGSSSGSVSFERGSKVILVSSVPTTKLSSAFGGLLSVLTLT